MKLSIVKYRALFNRKKRLNKQGKAPIEIECLLTRKRKFISTRIFITPGEWTMTKNHSYINSKNPNAASLNQLIKNTIYNLTEYELKKREKELLFDLSYFDEYLRTKETVSFTAFYEQEFASSKQLKPNTRKSHNKTLSKIKLFKPNILFSDINYTFVKNFDNFLITKFKLTQNSRWSEHKNIKVYLNIAIKKGIAERDVYNGYNKFKITKTETTREALTDSEISTIENLDIPENSHLHTIRDFLLLSCYTGLRYSDMAKISPNNITYSSQGMILSFTMEKTDVQIQLPLYALFKTDENQSKPEQIISKYWEWGTLSGSFFKHLSNQHLNREYKELAKLAKLNKRLTCHVARHTFAVALTGKNVQIQILQKLLGHGDVKTTMIYQRFTPQFVSDQLDKVNW